jgi:hypothetical protein
VNMEPVPQKIHVHAPLGGSPIPPRVVYAIRVPLGSSRPSLGIASVR